MVMLMLVNNIFMFPQSGKQKVYTIGARGGKFCPRIKKMKITEQEFDAIRQGLRAAFNEGCLDENVAYPAFDKMKEVYKRYRWFKSQLSAYDPSELRREYIEEFGSWGKGEENE